MKIITNRWGREGRNCIFSIELFLKEFVISVLKFAAEFNYSECIQIVYNNISLTEDSTEKCYIESTKQINVAGKA